MNNDHVFDNESLLMSDFPAQCLTFGNLDPVII